MLSSSNMYLFSFGEEEEVSGYVSRCPIFIKILFTPSECTSAVYRYTGLCRHYLADQTLQVFPLSFGIRTETANLPLVLLSLIKISGLICPVGETPWIRLENELPSVYSLVTTGAVLVGPVSLRFSCQKSF